MSLGTKSSFSNAPWDFQISVFFLISGQCFSDNFSRFKYFPETYWLVLLAFMVKKLFTKNCSDVHYFLIDFSYLASLLAFMVKKLFTKNCSDVHYFLIDFSCLASLGIRSSLVNSRIISWALSKCLFSYLPCTQI